MIVTGLFDKPSFAAYQHKKHPEVIALMYSSGLGTILRASGQDSEDVGELFQSFRALVLGLDLSFENWRPVNIRFNKSEECRLITQGDSIIQVQPVIREFPELGLIQIEFINHVVLFNPQNPADMVIYNYPGEQLRTFNTARSRLIGLDISYQGLTIIED